MGEDTPHIYDLPGGAVVDLRFVTSIDVVESNEGDGLLGGSFRVATSSVPLWGRGDSRPELSKERDKLIEAWKKIQSIDWE